MPEATTTAAAPATTAAATTTDTAATTAATATAATTTAAETPWHGYTEQADIDYVKTKGWSGPQDVLKSYRGAEKLIGKNPDALVVLPRADDPEGNRALLTKLGLPEKADAYDMKLGLPKDAKLNEGFSKQMQGILHEAGILPSQAKTLVEKYNGLTMAIQEQQVKDYDLNVAADKKALADEWRGGYDRMMTKAQTAAKSLGFDENALAAIERHYGYAATMKLFAEIGGKLGEDTFASGEKKTEFGDTLTPAEAKSRWDEKKLDANFMSALKDPSHPGHKTAQEMQSKLFKVMYPNP